MIKMFETRGNNGGIDFNLALSLSTRKPKEEKSGVCVCVCVVARNTIEFYCCVPWSA